MRTIIKTGTLIRGDGRCPEKNMVIVILDGRIVTIEAASKSRWVGQEGDRIIDATDKVILPGLINAHVHLSLDASSKPLEAFTASEGLIAIKATLRAENVLMHGITTVRDLGAKDSAILALRDAIEEGIVPGPRIHACGQVITTTGGHWRWWSYVADGIDEITKAARHMLQMGADVIKLMATGGVGKPGQQPGAAAFNIDEIRAAVCEAHKKGRRVAAHCHGVEGIKNAVKAGVDTVEHGSFLDKEAIEMMIDRGTYLIPTLIPYERIIQHGIESGLPQLLVEGCAEAYERMQSSFVQAIEAGARVAVGTDGGTYFNPPADIVEELKLRAQLGVPNMELITMATKMGAKALGLEEEIGMLEEGKMADIIAIEGDPMKDISALGKISWVMKGGEIFHKKEDSPVDTRMSQEESI